MRSVFEDNGLGDIGLDANAIFVAEGQAGALLLRIAENADKNGGDAEISGHIHVIDGDQAALIDGDFAANGLANLALQKFAHTL